MIDSTQNFPTYFFFFLFVLFSPGHMISEVDHHKTHLLDHLATVETIIYSGCIIYLRDNLFKNKNQTEREKILCANKIIIALHKSLLLMSHLTIQL